MFVATHSKNDALDLKLLSSIKSYDRSSNGVFVDKTNKIWHEKHNYPSLPVQPITLQCPYCSATLNQSERVECECGLVLVAQCPDIIDVMKGMDKKADVFGATLAYSNETPTYGYYKGIDCHYVGMLSKSEAMTLMVVLIINGIHWLQISEGCGKI